MKAIDYKIHIKGLKSQSGSIPIIALKEIANALLKSTDRILRLFVEGQSVKSGKAPEWLKKSLDFTIMGITSGSTVITLEAPLLIDSMPEYFEQKKLWQEDVINPDESALSLLSKSVADVSAENRDSDYFDTGVLDALLAFKSITPSYASEISIVSKKKSSDNFKISPDEIKKIKTIKASTPLPRTIVLSGFFNLIEHHNRRFQLRMENGKTLNGIMDPELVAPERMRQFWGQRVTIKGKGNFKPSGNIRNIEAQFIQSFESGDEILQQVPIIQKQFKFTEEYFAEKNSSKSLKKIWGKWPGNESIDELLEALKHSSV